MYPDLSKEELIVLRSHLSRELKYFHQTPVEWDFWNKTCRLDELDKILKKIEVCLQQEKTK